VGSGLLTRRPGGKKRLKAGGERIRVGVHVCWLSVGVRWTIVSGPTMGARKHQQ
jgi:hypothetical protein